MIYDIPRLRAQLTSAFPEGSIVGEHTATEHWYRNRGTGQLAPSVTTIQSILTKPYLRQWSVNQAIRHISAELFVPGQVIHVESERFEEILKQSSRAHENTRDQAAEWGTKAHQAFEDYLNDWINTGTHKESAKDYLKEGAAIEEIAACRSFDRFVGENEIVPIAAELKVWYDKAGVTFAGTADAIVVVRDVYKDRVGGQGCNHDYAPQEKKLWCCMCGREVTERLVLGDWKTSNVVAGKNEYAFQTSAYAKSIEIQTNWKFKDVWIVRFDKAKADYEIVKVIDRKKSFSVFCSIAKTFKKMKEIENIKLLEQNNKKHIITI